eukprot:256638-Prymnesium_polylepis.1
MRTSSSPCSRTTRAVVVSAPPDGGARDSVAKACGIIRGVIRLAFIARACATAFFSAAACVAAP